jgi:hypothetical protein
MYVAILAQDFALCIPSSFRIPALASVATEPLALPSDDHGRATLLTADDTIGVLNRDPMQPHHDVAQYLPRICFALDVLEIIELGLFSCRRLRAKSCPQIVFMHEPCPRILNVEPLPLVSDAICGGSHEAYSLLVCFGEWLQD